MITKVTHKKAITLNISNVIKRMSKQLQISYDAYIMLRYELAFAWLQYNNYYEATARYYILSPTFFHWWYQQLSYKENQFIELFNEVRDDNKLDFFIEFVVKTLQVKPAKVIVEQIRKEGYVAMQKNAGNKHLKIFR